MHDKCSMMNLIYEDRHFRFNQVGSERWYAAVDIVYALGLKDTPSMLRMIDPIQRVKMQFGGRHVYAINQQGLDQAFLIAPGKNVEQLRLWLSRLDDAPRQLIDPTDAIKKQCADFALDYLHKCRESLRNAGAAPVEWNEAKAQQAANGMAYALLRHRRWLMSFSDEGKPQLAPVPLDAMVMNTQSLIHWIQDDNGATHQQLSLISSAINQRLDNPSLTSQAY